MATNTILEKALRGKLPESAGDVTLDDMRVMLEVLLTRIMEAELARELRLSDTNMPKTAAAIGTARDHGASIRG